MSWRSMAAIAFLGLLVLRSDDVNKQKQVTEIHRVYEALCFSTGYSKGKAHVIEVAQFIPMQVFDPFTRSFKAGKYRYEELGMRRESRFMPRGYEEISPDLRLVIFPSDFFTTVDLIEALGGEYRPATYRELIGFGAATADFGLEHNVVALGSWTVSSSGAIDVPLITGTKTGRGIVTASCDSRWKKDTLFLVVPTPRPFRLSPRMQ